MFPPTPPPPCTGVGASEGVGDVSLLPSTSTPPSTGAGVGAGVGVVVEVGVGAFIVTLILLMQKHTFWVTVTPMVAVPADPAVQVIVLLP